MTIIIQLSMIYTKKRSKDNNVRFIGFNLKLLSQIIIGVRIIRWFELMDELR